MSIEWRNIFIIPIYLVGFILIPRNFCLLFGCYRVIDISYIAYFYILYEQIIIIIIDVLEIIKQHTT